MDPDASTSSRPRHHDDGRRPRDRDRDSRRQQRERPDSRSRRRSRTPESPRQRHRHRQRDHDGERGRQRGTATSPGRERDASKENRRRRSRDRRRLPRRASDDTIQQKRSLAKHRGPLPSQQDSFATDTGQGPDESNKEKPNYGNTGALAAASNSVIRANGTSTTLKYHEPPEARKPLPRDQWKLFVFKGGDVVDTIDLNLKSCWLVGRDSGVADVMAEHPSISKQHAVVQFRYTEKRNEFDDKVGRIKPYLLDLDSANGTVLNDGAVPPSRYLELRNKDMILFGHSAREYIVMLAPRD